MRTVLVLVLLCMANISQAAGPELSGNFSSPHKIGMLGYPDESSCANDAGSWENEVCFFMASDDVAIRAKSKGYSIKINTITTNAHTCDFEAAGKFVAPNKIVSRVEVGAGAICEVTVSFNKSARQLSVATNGECSYFCGANASLDIAKAVRR